MGQDVYSMMDRFDDDTRQATGFDMRIEGSQAGGTATGQTIIKETSLKRINLYLRFLEDFSMPDFSNLWGDTIQQFYFMSSNTKTKKVKDRANNVEKEKIFRSVKVPKSEVTALRAVESVGEYNFLDVTPEDIRGNFDFNIKIGTTIAISKELSKQIKLQLYSILGADELVNREKLVSDLLTSHELDPEEYMNINQQVDGDQSVAFAEEQNKQMIAGEVPQIIPELITPEHIQLHDALIQSGQVKASVKEMIQKHVIEEMRVAKVGVMPGGNGGDESVGKTQSHPALERVSGLTGPLAKMPGLTKAASEPSTAAEVSSPTVTGPAPNKPVVKP